MTNGYIVLTKGEPNLYKHAVDAINLGKPIYYADGNKVAFVNSIELVSTDVVIKTSDKQITVEADGTATEKDVSLKALVFDTNDYVITGASSRTDCSYYTLITSLDVKKLSELPAGDYVVLQGQLKVGEDLVDILGIEITESTYSFYGSDDNHYTFTISTDNEGREIKL